MTLPEAAQFQTLSTWLGVQEWWMLHPHSGLLHGQAYRQHWGADRFTCAPWNQDDFSWTNYGMVQLYIILFSWKKDKLQLQPFAHTGPPSGRGWCLWYRQSSRQSFALPRSTKASHPSWTNPPKETREGVVVGFLDVHMNLLRVFSKGERWVRN